MYIGLKQNMLNPLLLKPEVEFSGVEKPKLMYVPWLPLFLDIYATLDMKEEAEVYFDIRKENKSEINKI